MSNYFIRGCLGVTAIALLLIAAAGSVPAKPEFLVKFKSTYTNVKPGGTIDTASCNLCHLNGPPILNPYGASVKGALTKANAKMVDATVLHSLDSVDSDGDGFSNLEEINADTLPGDPKSHPAGKPLASARPASQTDTGETSPFDIKAIVFAKHAQHPVVVHLPIGLFIASLFFDLVSRFRKSAGSSAGLNIAAYYNLMFAAVSAVVSVITGIIAWQWKFEGAALQGNLLLHLILGIVTCLLMFVLWAMRKKSTLTISDPVTTTYLALAIVTGLILGLTGHIGGILSGVA